MRYLYKLYIDHQRQVHIKLSVASKLCRVSRSICSAIPTNGLRSATLFQLSTVYSLESCSKQNTLMAEDSDSGVERKYLMLVSGHADVP